MDVVEEGSSSSEGVVESPTHCNAHDQKVSFTESSQDNGRKNKNNCQVDTTNTQKRK